VPRGHFTEVRSEKVAKKTNDGAGESPDIEMENSDAVNIWPVRRSPAYRRLGSKARRITYFSNPVMPKGRFMEVISQKVAKSATDLRAALYEGANWSSFRVLLGDSLIQWRTLVLVVRTKFMT
jgi:hypothetical protein